MIKPTIQFWLEQRNKKTIQELQDVVCNEYSVPKEMLFPNKKENDEDIIEILYLWYCQFRENMIILDKDLVKQTEDILLEYGMM